ncbi:class I SAM-dependent methyltransferase [Allorhizobium undicola]|uniref:class I SAM-dependent methyltransferase n=1 Tax=Allorhizobium undicola TaxID=78527 RepID=UPI000A9845ED|nr:class I SAM-dependent methyltransferase [Allorhizobium undicola]
MNDFFSFELQSFAEFERHGWEKLSSAYDGSWGHVTSAFAPAILNALPDLEGLRLMDVATGPGYAARLALQRGAKVTGVDFSANMIASARQNVPKAQFEIADVKSLPFNDGEFDFAISNFGFQHFDDPAAAFREIARVLKPHGMLSFTVWAESARNAASLILEQALDRFAQEPNCVPEGPSYDFLLNMEQLHRILQQAGFAAKTTKSCLHVIPWRLRDEDELFRAEYTSSVRSGARLRHEGETARERIREAMAKDIRNHYNEDGKLIIPMAAYIISVRKA